MVIFINQIRQKIGVMFGSPETTTGGNALKFYCSVRMDIRRIGAIKKDESVVGNRTRVKVVKNKLAPPFREVEFDILYGEGISRTGEILDLGVAANIIDKSGAWMSFNGERIGQGRDNAKVFLQEHPEVAEQLEAKLLAHHSVTRIGVDAPASAGDSARSDAIKGDAIKGDAIKGDAARGDAARGDAARGDAARGDAARGDAVRAVAEEPARPSRPQAEGKGAAGAVRNGSARGRANA
jgi:recombination protein RecA